MAVTNIFTTNRSTTIVRPQPSVAGRSTVAFVPGTTTYSAGDVLGFCEFTQCARKDGGSGRVMDMKILDAGDITGSTAFNVVLFSATPSTTFVENAAFAPGVLDLATMFAFEEFSNTDSADIGNELHIWTRRFAGGIPYVCAADSQSLFAVIQVEANITFAALDVVQLSLGLEID